ncbi:MAG: arabinofuranosidase catalytic domain-containing protein [Nitrosotalea sp.]
MSSGIIAAGYNILPLDFVPSSAVAAAYSVRRLRTSYTSNLMNIRRSSDNATTDVAYDGSNKLSLNSTVSAGGILGTWVGANNAFVAKWYDQSGNANHATQSTTTAQPQIISSGAILTQNSQPSLKYVEANSNTLNAPDSASLDLNSTMSFFAIVSFTTTPGVTAIIDKRSTTGTTPGYHYYIISPNNYGMQWNGATTGGTFSVTVTLATSTLYSFSATATIGAGVTLYDSNINEGSGTLASVGSSINTNPLMVGAHSSSMTAYLNGFLSEVILLNTVASNQQISAMINNQRNFYSIT